MPPHLIDGEPHTHHDRPKRVRQPGEPLRIDWLDSSFIEIPLYK